MPISPESPSPSGASASHAWRPRRPRWLRSGWLALARRVLEGWERRSPDSRMLRTGEVLVRGGVITQAQLERALATQKPDGLPLGQVVVHLSYAEEAEVVRALNDHYRIHAASLEDNIPGLLASREASRESLSQLRRGLRVRLSLVLGAVIWVTTFVLTLVLLGRHETALTENAVRMGSLSLGYLAEQAREPLLQGDTRALQTAVKTALAVDGVLSAAVLDADGTVRAHADPAAIGRPLETDPTLEADAGRADDVRYAVVEHPSGPPGLELARPILRKGREVGQARLHLSLADVSDRLQQETLVSAAIAVLILIFGVLLAVQQGGRLLRPFSALLASARDGSGGQVFRVRVRPRHEFEDLAGAFDAISRELTQKLLVERSLGRYVHPGVVEHIRSKPEEPWLKGIRREATVLFTDVRGFTAVAERTEPEELVEALNAYFAIAARIIVEQGGHVDKYIGDGVLGVFGVPTPHEDHAMRAVKAAMDMQRALRRRSRGDLNPFLQNVGIGVNSGPLLAGNIGSEERMEYTVIGDCVNVASRLTAMAEPGEVIVSDSVAEAIPRHLITLSTLEDRQLKGKKEPIRAHKVLKIEF